MITQYKTSSTKLNLTHIAFYMILMIAVLPIVDYYCNWYITAIPVIVILAVLAKGSRSMNDALTLLMLCVVFLLIQQWAVYRNASFIYRMINGVINMTPGLFAIYIRRCDDHKFIKRFLQFGVLLMMITSITTIIGLNIFPFASRELASGTQIYDTTRYLRRNIGGFEFIYALVLFIPIVIWLIKHTNGFAKVLNVVALVLYVLCIFESQYTIAIVMSVVAFLLVLFVRNIKTAIALTSAFILFFILGGTGVLSKIFLFASEHINTNYVSDRLLQVSQLLSGTALHTNTTTERLDFYLLDLKNIIASPIFGNNLFSFSKSYISGHSVILDLLSGAGLVGMTAVVLIFRKIYLLVSFLDAGKDSTTLICWLLFILISVLNPSGFMIVYMVLFTFTVCIQRLTEIEVPDKARQNQGSNR